MSAIGFQIYNPDVGHIEFRNLVTTNSANVLKQITDNDDGALFSAENIDILFFGVNKSDDFIFI